MIICAFPHILDSGLVCLFCYYYKNTFKSSNVICN